MPYHSILCRYDSQHFIPIPRFISNISCFVQLHSNSRHRSRSRSHDRDRRRRWDREDEDSNRHHRRRRSRSRSRSPRGHEKREGGKVSRWAEKPSQPIVSNIYNGKVTSIMNFGCFVQLEGNWWALDRIKVGSIFVFFLKFFFIM